MGIRSARVVSAPKSPLLATSCSERCFSCAAQPFASTTHLTSSWERVWQSAIRNLTSPASFRAACHTLAVVLAADVLGYARVKESIEDLLSKLDVLGPVYACDSSLKFVSLLAARQVSKKPGDGKIIVEHTMHWFFARWNPSQFPSIVLFRYFKLTHARQGVRPQHDDETWFQA